MDADDVLRFGAPDLSLLVYPDRVEAAAKKRSKTYPMSEIAEVLVAARPKRLVIVTHEGKRHQFNIGRDSEAARGAIARHLNRTIV